MGRERDRCDSRVQHDHRERRRDRVAGAAPGRGDRAAPVRARQPCSDRARGGGGHGPRGDRRGDGVPAAPWRRPVTSHPGGGGRAGGAGPGPPRLLTLTRPRRVAPVASPLVIGPAVHAHDGVASVSARAGLERRRGCRVMEDRGDPMSVGTRRPHSWSPAAAGPPPALLTTSGGTPPDLPGHDAAPPFPADTASAPHFAGHPCLRCALLVAASALTTNV